MLWDMSSIEDATEKGRNLGEPDDGLQIKNSRRSVDSTQVSASETEEAAERKAARTSETIPVPAPRYKTHTAVDAQSQSTTTKKEEKTRMMVHLIRLCDICRIGTASP